MAFYINVSATRETLKHELAEPPRSSILVLSECIHVVTYLLHTAAGGCKRLTCAGLCITTLPLKGETRDVTKSEVAQRNRKLDSS